MSRPYAEVIGDPIAHSKSPLIHNLWLEKLGIDADYRRCHVRAEDLADYFKRRRDDAKWRGCNVTSPYKVDALVFVDDHDASVLQVGAANCIIPNNGGLIAYNTDVAGVDVAIPRAHNSVCLIGAGGAARAAIPSLDVLSVRDIRVIARDIKKAAASLNDLAYDFKFYDFDHAAEAFHGVEGIINASPLGMTGKHKMPQSILDTLSHSASDAYVFDMVYAPLETDLLQAAQRAGRQPVDGLVMLVGQAAGAFAKFFGQSAPRAYDAELRALLIA